MAVLVQSAFGYREATTDQGIEVVLPERVRVGSLLVADVVWNDPSVDPGGSSFWHNNETGGTYSYSILDGPNVADASLRLLTTYVANSETGIHRFAYLISRSPLDLTVAVYEYAGVLTTSPLGVTSTGTGTGTAASSGTTSTTAQADCLVHGAVARSTGTTVDVALGGSGYTQLVSIADATLGVPLTTSYKFITSAGTQAAQYTYASSVTWLASVSVFHLDTTWVAPAQQNFPASRPGGA